MPKRGEVGFGKRSKQLPRFIGPFEILERVGIVAYQLPLPPIMLCVHEVFHVSMLRTYTPDPTHVVDHVFLKVMPKRGEVRFGKRSKQFPRFIGPFEILERVGIVAYRLALPPIMLGVHEVFHVSMLRTYTPDPSHVVDWGEIEVDTDGTFEEGPVCIMDSRDQVL